MRYFVKTASAAALSLCLFGTASAAPDKPKASFDNLTLRVALAALDGGATILNVQSDGSYTVTEEGGIAHFIMIKAQGTLTQAQLDSLEKGLKSTIAEAPPANLPGIVPGSPQFTISWSQDGKSGSTSGASNTKGAIEDAKQQGLDVSAWKVVASLESKMSKLEGKLEAEYKPALPVPEKKPAFDEISIEEKSSWTGGVDKLTVKADGTYTMERSLGQSTLTGTLTTAQMNAINNAYETGVLEKENGKLVGGMIPDDTQFTISATQGSNKYSVNGYMDSTNLGDLKKLASALMGDANAVQPPVAHPIDKTADDAATTGVSDAIKSRGAGTQAPRTGMDAVIDKRVDDAKGSAGDKAGEK